MILLLSLVVPAFEILLGVLTYNLDTPNTGIQGFIAGGLFGLAFSDIFKAISELKERRRADKYLKHMQEEMMQRQQQDRNDLREALVGAKKRP